MTQIVVFIDELALQPGNAVVTPVKSAQRYVAMKECRRNVAGVSPRFQKSAFVVHSGGKGRSRGESEFDVEQVIYTADGTWLRVSLETMKRLLQNETGALLTVGCVRNRGNGPRFECSVGSQLI